MMNMPRVQKSIGTVRFVEDVMTKSFERDTVKEESASPHSPDQVVAGLHLTSCAHVEVSQLPKSPGGTSGVSVASGRIDMKCSYSPNAPIRYT